MSTGGNDDELSAFALLALPLLFVMYVAIRHGPSGNIQNYINWRFSHSSPNVLFLYSPKDARDELHAELFSGVKPFKKNPKEGSYARQLAKHVKQDAPTSSSSSVEVTHTGIKKDMGTVAPGPSTADDFTTSSTLTI